MVVEVERCARLGIADLVVHPGAHVGSGEAVGLKRIAAALDRVLEATAGLAVTIDLETTAGQGSCLGNRFEHLRAILDEASEASRLGVCVDTCHIFAAGYSFDTRERDDETMDDLDRIVGLARVRVWHLNDSLREHASRVDRHAGIGAGRIGLEPFRFVVNDPRFRALPMILETPKGIEEGEELDARNLRTLRGLVAS
jgi:deoxyribonuclease-4